MERNMNHRIHIADLGQLERQEKQSIALRRALYSGKALDLENYHTYEEVLAIVIHFTYQFNLLFNTYR